ncbi:MAG: NAD-dependent epimerase/dehydratase family protein [Puniceicoccales bacterium]|nr:NAD-dependent epimerase/dehydratase family protein [Puniceicoccales bacterium]
MRILVTGGGGFLGRTLVGELRKHGHAVRTFSRNAPCPFPVLADAPPVETILGDIADANAVLRACAGMDAVIHTAAKAGIWGARAEFHRVNVVGTLNVIGGCRGAGVAFLVHTSTPSVTHTGGPLRGVDEAQPLVRRCHCPYPESKAEAERRVLEADGPALRTIALRPHLIWGAGDPHLVPRVIQRARAGKLRIVGDGANRVDLTHVGNAALAHRLALEALAGLGPCPANAVAGRAFFVSDGAPVRLWDWINDLLARLGLPRVTRRVPLGAARLSGALCEIFWKCLPLAGEPPMTRFIATELACDHWFDISAARHALGYVPSRDLGAALDRLVESLRA